MAAVAMRQLLEAGVHFGHQTARWNPKMRPYIFTERNGIHIVDLRQTLETINESYKVVSDIAAAGGTVLFVGTKKQTQAAVEDAAKRAEMPYVNNRWLGGMLTNFQTIHKRILYMRELEQMETSGEMESLPKKERIRLRRELVKLQTVLGGVRDLRSQPDAMFVVDINAEHIAVAEASRLGIPIIALVQMFIGMILALQMAPTLASYGQIERVADIVAIMRQGKLMVVESLDTLKCQTHELTITLAAGASQPPEVPGQVLCSRRRARQWQVLASNLDESQIDALRDDESIVAIEVRTPGLEKIFVAYMQSGRDDTGSPELAPSATTLSEQNV